MAFNLTRRVALALVLVLFVCSLPAMLPEAEAHGPHTVAWGSQGSDVWDLQYRLQLLGYGPSSVDGEFGRQTYHSVVRFQQDYGLRVDGIAGPQTWRALKKFSLSLREVQLVAQAVYGEARGEPFKGQVAVAAVVMNRIASSQFPNTARGVIFEPQAFTAVDDGQIWLTPDEEARKAVREAIKGWDPTHDSLYYFNPHTATSDWIWSRPQTVQIGKHIFAR